MLTSIALIILCGLALGGVFQKINLPSLLGMIICGMILGPYALNMLDENLINISADIRQIALIIILTRAGLSLDMNALKKVGRPAFLMCFLPACFEILGAILLAPPLLHVSVLEAAILGSVIAAVSPAVIVPRMITLMEKGYGKKHSIPQLILAGASVDDVFVIVLFTSFTSLASTGKFSPFQFIQVPISIMSGIGAGILLGLTLILFFRKIHIRDSVKLLILLSMSFLLIEVQNQLEGILPFSGLLAIMSLSITIKQKYNLLAVRLSTKYNKLWVGAEILLFVLVGTTVDLSYALRAGVMAIFFVLAALLFRMTGVFFCLLRTKLTKKERCFCIIAYTPKATVQAAIGAVPLAMGLPCGKIVLTVAVLSILITAPFGAICIDKGYQRLLKKE